MKMNDFLVLGGDQRFIYAAEFISERYSCSTFGIGELPYNSKTTTLTTLNGKYKNIVLPLPLSRDEININFPITNQTIPIKSINELLFDDSIIFTGNSNKELESVCVKHKIIDYYSEEFAIMNAIPTAEGVMRIILKESQSKLFGMNILVLGAGRTAKAITKLLISFDANVTGLARSNDELAFMKKIGASIFNISELSTLLSEFNIIINTIPFSILTDENIELLKRDALLIDIASVSVVESVHKIKKRGIKYIHALGLPGKFSPVSSGKIIADSIMSYL